MQEAAIWVLGRMQAERAELEPRTMPTTDIAITVIPEEYAAITTRLEAEGCQLRHFAGTRRNPNRFAWLTGQLANADGQSFQIVVALAATPGPTQMAPVVSATIARHKPR
jgi:hypothetical protein